MNQQLLIWLSAAGKLPKNNGGISWRRNSGLQDGSTLTDVKGGLVGGYYDAGDNTKFHFPMSFAMTMLSWSVIEYEHKYKDIGEYNHVRELIKWGTDYLLLTFNSSSTKIDKIYSQVSSIHLFSIDYTNFSVLQLQPPVILQCDIFKFWWVLPLDQPTHLPQHYLDN